MPDDIRAPILSLLEQLSTRKLDALKQLFWAELNYDRANEPLSTRDWPGAASQALAEPPTLLATAGNDSAFHIIYGRLESGQLRPDLERPVISRLLAAHPYALFVFSDSSQANWHFVNVRYEKSRGPAGEADNGVSSRRVFRRITVGPYERLRTAAERISLLDIATLSPDLLGLSPLVIQQRHDEAFDVEAVTRRFFSAYRAIFEKTEESIQGIKDENRRLFTQRLFNRLLFIIFLERKGWLSFEDGGRRRYDFLQALWEAHRREKAAGETVNFYNDRLKLLFFSGLNTQNEVDIVGIRPNGFLQGRIGQVPYLNGGLFEEDDLDRDAGIRTPDEALAPALGELLYHFNFTVTESTPLDIEVAVDPEMLGKIFEELVTGRHESGSYYTPKPVVAFMGQEALKGYLETSCPGEAGQAIAAFVEERDAGGLRNPERVLEALRAVKICDPACGSGAYLLGMLHELLDLRAALFTARRLDPLTAYQRKLEIIQHNLYGVDLDPFAVNIARLRLWLSLIVEFEGDTPPPLPNLDFKIEAGDSLAAPDPSGGLQPDMFRQQQVAEYFRLKGRYLDTHGPEKLALRQDIERLRADIAAWAHPRGGSGGFDWAVEFAEVFAGPALAVATLGGETQRESGFDIVLANPPYVRHELLGSEYKARLKPIYPEVYIGTADLYVYFYARALQLLRPGGMVAFISSNKFMRAGYGEKLRQLLTQKTTFHSVIDFGDLPVFNATTYPAIMVMRKCTPPQDHQARCLNIDDIATVNRLTEEVGNQAWLQPQSSLLPAGWSLVQSSTLNLINKLRHTGTPLNDYVAGKFYYGIKTGFNKAFVIDQATRDRLIAQDPRNAEIIKPWVRGRDIKRWFVEWAGLYVIFTRRGIDIGHYPAVRDYLKQYKKQLMPGAPGGRKPGSYEWYEIQDAIDYYEEFESPKIVYQEIATYQAFAFTKEPLFLNNKCFFIPTTDLFLLSVLNSNVCWFFLGQTASKLQGGAYAMQGPYISQIPIPTPTSAQKAAIEALVQKLLNVQGDETQVTEWEAELNALGYETYGLTAAEITLIEESLIQTR